jgi:RNA polymerase sigma factor (sigma-70 family)
MPVPPPSRSDRDLLAGIATDAEAFEELYRRYELVVAAFLMRRCRDPELAADLTTETFASALLNAERFRADGPVAGWLLGIAHHALLETWRRGRTERRARDRLGIEPLAPDPSYERVEALVDADAARPRLQRALDRLPQEQRDAITAHVLDDQPYPAIAGRLGIPEATVRQRVSRGLARLRTTLEGPQR